MQNWLLKLRRQGKSVLLIHHAGTNGRQRGTSRREDALGYGDSVATTRGLFAGTGSADSKFILKNCEIGWMRLELYHLKHGWRPWTLMDNSAFVGLPRT